MSAAKCPICAKPAQEKYHPFCSGRCADVDLNRWLTNRYALPATDEDEAPADAGGEE